MHFCILGCGDIAKVHAKLLHKLEHFIPGKPVRMSFASRSLERARDYKAQHRAELAIGSYEEALRHPDIDVIIICTPNDSHRDLAIAALQNGKDVIIEKPIACSVREVDEILAKAKEMKKQVLVGENHRFRPAIRYLERIIHAGELGVLKFICMNVMRNRPFRITEWRAQEARAGGGPMIDGGIHWVNALLTLGQNQSLQIPNLAAFEPPHTQENCPREDSFAIQCQFENGAVGCLNYSWGVQGSFPFKMMSVHGSKGSVYVANTGMIGWKSTGRVARPLLLPLRDWKGYVGMWHDFLITLSNRDRDSHPSLCPGEIGRRDLAFIEAAYAATAVKPAVQKNIRLG